MPTPKWEMTEFSEMERHLAHARQLRSDALKTWLAAAWRGAARGIGALWSRAGRAVHHPAT